MIDTRHEPTFGPATGQAPARRRQRTRAWPFVLAAIVAAAGWYWYSDLRTPEDVPVAVPHEAPSAPAAPAAVAYPPPNDAAPRPAAGNEVQDGLREAFGAEGVSRFLQATEFPRRFVATVDNLGRERAPVAVWPVQTTPGRFTVQPTADGMQISAENAARYRPFVQFASSLDAARVVGVYRRLYPVLQQSYRDLGFGDRSFHERLIAVADQLLATPEPAQEPLVATPEVKGPVQPAQPWRQYEFTDPALQSLSAGQKILLRLGAENRHRLKAKIREVRALLVQAPAQAR